MRRDELLKLSIVDITDTESHIIIKIPDSKTRVQRTFVVSGESNPLNYINYVRQYARLRPANVSSNRFFLKYASGKCVAQNVGINKIGQIPKEIATYLELLSPSEYTGHCFRRTSVTLLADAGGDLVTIKRHGGWKSSAVAEGYIDDSIKNKNDKILSNEQPNYLDQ